MLQGRKGSFCNQGKQLEQPIVAPCRHGALSDAWRLRVESDQGPDRYRNWRSSGWHRRFGTHRRQHGRHGGRRRRRGGGRSRNRQTHEVTMCSAPARTPPRRVSSSPVSPAQAGVFLFMLSFASPRALPQARAPAAPARQRTSPRFPHRFPEEHD